MNGSLIGKMLMVAMLVAGSLTLVSCSRGNEADVGGSAGRRGNQGMSGIYTGGDPRSLVGEITVEFKSGGKAFASAMGQTRECSYSVEGDKVIFDCGTGQGKEVYTILRDGSLTSGTGELSVTLKKK